MKICICDKCRDMFMALTIPNRCPNCGRKSVREICDHDIEQYWEHQKTVQEKTRLGLIPK